MPEPQKAAVQKKLAPYHALIREVVNEAWDEWVIVQRFRDSKGYARPLYTRTSANDIFDGIARRAIPRFGARPKVLVTVEPQTFKLYIAGILVRFKKGGEDNLGCSSPTQAALAFMEADASVPGFPSETTKVEIIWLPNDIWTALDRILVVARDGDRLIWEYEIPADSAGATGTIIPLPVPQNDALEPGELVKPKVRTTKKNEKQ